MLTIALLTLALSPVELVVEERVDAIECNSVFDCDCQLVFDQLIFWRWNEEAWRFDVVDWRLRNPHCGTPLLDGGEYWLLWDDDGIVRSVRAPVRLVTGYQHYQEMKEREWLPKERREGLRVPGKLKHR